MFNVYVKMSLCTSGSGLSTGGSGNLTSYSYSGAHAAAATAEAAKSKISYINNQGMTVTQDGQSKYMSMI